MTGKIKNNKICMKNNAKHRAKAKHQTCLTIPKGHPFSPSSSSTFSSPLLAYNHKYASSPPRFSSSSITELSSDDSAQTNRKPELPWPFSKKDSDWEILNCQLWLQFTHRGWLHGSPSHIWPPSYNLLRGRDWLPTPTFHWKKKGISKGKRTQMQWGLHLMTLHH